jgi:putative copper export protein
MSANIITITLVTFLHDLFTAAWVGGLILLGLSALPAMKKVLGGRPEMRQVMSAIQRRHRIVVYISIFGLLLTGLLQSRRATNFEGLFSTANPYAAALTVKHIFVLLMIAVALYRSLVLGRGSGPRSAAQERLNGVLLYLNMILGVLVLLVSGYVTALGLALAV